MLAVVTFFLAVGLVAGVSSQPQLVVPVLATPQLPGRCRGGTKGESRVSQQRSRDKALWNILTNKALSIYTEDLE